jgi:hypothetical protein
MEAAAWSALSQMGRLSGFSVRDDVRVRRFDQSADGPVRRREIPCRSRDEAVRVAAEQQAAEEDSDRVEWIYLHHPGRGWLARRVARHPVQRPAPRWRTWLSPLWEGIINIPF